jgi:hypothetical protein
MPDPTLEQLDQSLKQLRKEFDHDSEGLHIVITAVSKLSDQVDDKAKSTFDGIKDLAKRVAALEKKK